MDLIATASHTFTTSPALVSKDGSISFAALDRETAEICQRLAQHGIGKGARVALVMENSIPMLMLLLSLMRMGAVAAPLNYRFPASKVQGLLDRLEPALLIGPDILTSGLEAAEVLRPEILLETADGPWHISEPLRFDNSPATPVSIIHTSSSSGQPKAAVHSLANHYYNALGSNENIAFGPGDCWLLSLPLFHIGGYAIIVRALTGGGALAVPDRLMGLDEALGIYPVTHLSLVPTQLYRLLSNPENREKLSEMKAVLLGGSAVEPSLLEEACRCRVPVYLSYGSTEMGSQITTTSSPATSMTAGKPLAWREVAIGTDNEILVKGPCLFLGYLSQEGTERKTDAEGWFHTGDTGAISPSGELRVTGRKDNMFISGGENIHPEEIERALLSVNGIVRAMVVATPDSEYGMRPVAWIETREEAPGDQEILETIRESLGRLKTPIMLNRTTAWKLLSGTEKIDRQWYREKGSRQK